MESGNCIELKLREKQEIAIFFPSRIIFHRAREVSFSITETAINALPVLILTLVLMKKAAGQGDPVLCLLPCDLVNSVSDSRDGILGESHDQFVVETSQAGDPKISKSFPIGTFNKNQYGRRILVFIRPMVVDLALRSKATEEPGGAHRRRWAPPLGRAPKQLCSGGEYDVVGV